MQDEKSLALHVGALHKASPTKGESCTVPGGPMRSKVSLILYVAALGESLRTAAPSQSILMERTW